MAYNKVLERRIDQLTAGWLVDKKAMFGGIAYMYHAAEGDKPALVVAIMGDGVLFKIVPEQRQKWLEQPGVHEATMGVRTMRNWLHADSQAIVTDEALAEVIETGRDSVLK